MFISPLSFSSNYILTKHDHSTISTIPKYKKLMVYRTWEKFGVGKHWWIWWIECHSLMFYHQLLPFILSYSSTCSSVHQYFTVQLVWIELFANILPHLNFPLTVIATISYITLAIVDSITYPNLVYLQSRNMYSYSNYFTCNITYIV